MVVKLEHKKIKCYNCLTPLFQFSPFNGNCTHTIYGNLCGDHYEREHRYAQELFVVGKSQFGEYRAGYRDESHQDVG